MPIELRQTSHLGDNEIHIAQSPTSSSEFFRVSVLCLKDQWEESNSLLSQPRIGISLTNTPVESLKWWTREELR